MDNIEKATIIENAAEWLEQHEWIQKEYYRYDDDTDEVVGACMSGVLSLAIEEANYNYIDHDFVKEEVSADLPLIGNHVHYYSIPGYNDTCGRSKQEVIDQLMVTAKRLRNS